MNRKEFEKNCWNVYLAIENDCVKFSSQFRS